MYRSIRIDISVPFTLLFFRVGGWGEIQADLYLMGMLCDFRLKFEQYNQILSNMNGIWPNYKNLAEGI